MSALDRFSPMSSAEEKAAEWQACNSCGEVRHYTEVNDDGECRECAPVRPAAPVVTASAAPTPKPKRAAPPAPKPQNKCGPVDFNEVRAAVDAAATAAEGQHWICWDCGARLYLIEGKKSHKFFFSHASGGNPCKTRAIFFTTREEAEQAEDVFY
jgi:hypothetical protein